VRFLEQQEGPQGEDAGALMADANFDNADMTEVIMSKAYAGNASFKGARPHHRPPLLPQSSCAPWQRAVPWQHLHSFSFDHYGRAPLHRVNEGHASIPELPTGHVLLWYHRWRRHSIFKPFTGRQQDMFLSFGASMLGSGDSCGGLMWHPMRANPWNKALFLFPWVCVSWRCAGTDFTNGVLDRVVFDGADLTGAKFNNTVLSGTTFLGADLEGTDFEDALIGYVDIQKLCRNTTLSPDAKAQLGCR